MKAVVCKAYGPPEVLEMREVDKPVPADNEILVKIEVTTVSAGDCRMRGFNVSPSYWIPARLALGIRKPRRPVLGMELAGVVEAVGKRVTRFMAGDRVCASTTESGFGAYAEYRCLAEDAVAAPIPDELAFQEATTIPVGARTALHFLREAKIQSGQKVLIYGASGSVGTFAVQLGKYYGGEVTGVCSGANVQLVRSLGADHVIDYTREDVAGNGQVYDVVFDTVGKLDYAAAMGCLSKDGTYLQAVAFPGTAARMRWTALTSSRRTAGGGPAPDSSDLVFLAELMVEAEVRAVIDRCYPLEEIVEAHRYVDTGRKRGNVIIQVAGPAIVR